jgi:hypothetical protein
MTWTFSPARSGMAALAAEWDGLNRRLCRAHPFSIPPSSALWSTASPAPTTRWRSTGDRVEAMLLLQAPRHGICSTFLPSQAQIGPTLLPAPGPVELTRGYRQPKERFSTLRRREPTEPARPQPPPTRSSGGYSPWAAAPRLKRTVV